MRSQTVSEASKGDRQAQRLLAKQTAAKSSGSLSDGAVHRVALQSAVPAFRLLPSFLYNSSASHRSQRGDRLSCGSRLRFCKLAALLCFAVLAAAPAPAQQRREREPNSVYAARRAKLGAQLDAPLILWGYTGREEVSEAYVFAQEENFYYLTGHNEEGAGLLILPAKRTPPATNSVSTPDLANSPKSAASSFVPSDVPQEILFLPAKDPAREKWNGLRMSPSDPGIEARTGFATVKPFGEMRAIFERLAAANLTLSTTAAYEKQ